LATIADIDLRLLRVFMAVVHSGSFTAAQAVLNVSQSTISNHMTALEERLGYRLCQRGRVGFRLTAKGRSVFEACERMLGAIESFEHLAASLRGELAGELRIGMSDSIVTDPNSPLVAALRSFSARPHSVFVHLSVEPPQTLQHGVLDGRMDVAFGSFTKVIKGLNHLHIYREPNGMYCGRGHDLYSTPANSVTLEKIRDQRIVSRRYWNLEDVYQIGVRRPHASVEEMEAVLALVLSGGYLGFLPDHFAEPWVASGALKPLMPGRLMHHASFDLITRSGTVADPPLSAFIEDFKKAATSLGHLKNGEIQNDTG
jgi:LysR family transcriptional regulator, transcriptional activator for bauABCD operon